MDKESKFENKYFSSPLKKKENKVKSKWDNMCVFFVCPQ